MSEQVDFKILEGPHLRCLGTMYYYSGPNAKHGFYNYKGECHSVTLESINITNIAGIVATAVHKLTNDPVLKQCPPEILAETHGVITLCQLVSQLKRDLKKQKVSK